MKITGALLVVALVSGAGCGDGRTGQVEDDGAVPPGAIPAAEDVRPADPGADGGVTTAGDTAPPAPAASETDTLTTGPGPEGRIRPR